MLSSAIVREVSRTSEPAYISGWVLTVENLIRRTIGSDWESGYYKLTKVAAKRVTNEINQERPWAATKEVPALPASEVRAIEGTPSVEYELEGELVTQS